MSILLIIVLAIIAISGLHGAAKGFLRLLFSFVAVILMIGLVSYASPHISKAIQTHTNIGSGISAYVAERLEDSVSGAATSVVENQAGTLSEGSGLPDVLWEQLICTGLEKTETAISQSGIYQQIGDQLAGVVLTIISFLIALTIALIVVHIIGKVTDLANKVPVLGGVNRFIGFIAGIVLGFITVWFIFLIFGILSGTQLGQVLLTEINKNVFLSALYNDNLLLKLLLYFF